MPGTRQNMQTFKKGSLACDAKSIIEVITCLSHVCHSKHAKSTKLHAGVVATPQMLAFPSKSVCLSHSDNNGYCLHKQHVYISSANACNPFNQEMDYLQVGWYMAAVGYSFLPGNLQMLLHIATRGRTSGPLNPDLNPKQASDSSR